eukprot:m.13896 g.13896  ORF g.13896 m.13896 type:complete len:62 (-) comp7447_c0_seq1:2929-3114(-)
MNEKRKEEKQSSFLTQQLETSVLQQRPILPAAYFVSKKEKCTNIPRAFLIFLHHLSTKQVL